MLNFFIDLIFSLMLIHNYQFSNKQVKLNEYKNYIFLGSQSKQAIGHSCFRLDKSGIKDYPKIHLWFLDEIEIEENSRSQGHGTALLKFSIQTMRKLQNLPILIVPPKYDGDPDLSKRDLTKRIIAWYERNGFKMHTGFMELSVGCGYPHESHS